MVKRIVVASCILFSPFFALAQYTTTYEQGVTDITTYATSGTNAWFKLAGGGVCAPNSLAPLYDGNVWCVGAADSQAYEWSQANQYWVQHSEMGSGLIALGGTDSSNLYSLKAYSTCGTGTYGVFRLYNGSWVWLNGCLKQFTVSVDDVIAGVDGKLLYSSNDNGTTWNTIGTGSWTYAANADAYTLCAVNNGQLYLLNSSGGMSLMSPQPPGTPSGCAISQGEFTLMEWGTSGNVYYFDVPTNVWKSVTMGGLVVAELTLSQKGYILALDSGGHPYHWNVYAAYIYGATTGSWDGCPGPSDHCAPGVTHTGKIQVKFPHSLNGVMGTWTGAPTSNMNANSWDANVLCDPFFGELTDAECVPTSTGQEVCNATGESLGSPPQPPSWQPSRDFGIYTGVRNIGTPYSMGNGWWDVSYDCYTTHTGACNPGTVAVCQKQSYSGDIQSNSSEAAVAAAHLQCQTGPWSFLSMYNTGQGAASCFQLPDPAGRTKKAQVPGNCY